MPSMQGRCVKTLFLTMHIRLKNIFDNSDYYYRFFVSSRCSFISSRSYSIGRGSERADCRGQGSWMLFSFCEILYSLITTLVCRSNLVAAEGFSEESLFSVHWIHCHVTKYHHSLVLWLFRLNVTLMSVFIFTVLLFYYVTHMFLV